MEKEKTSALQVSFRKAALSKKRVDVIASFSSFGPTPDGRIKPDLVAPGEIVSAAASATLGADYGAFDSFSAGSFSADYGNSPRVDRVDRVDTSSRPQPYTCGVTKIAGTSMATPVVAGAALLVRQYFEQGWYVGGRGGEGFGSGKDFASGPQTRRGDEKQPDPTFGFKPTAALVKAVLINGAVAMGGFSETGLPLEPPPSVRQGFGRACVGRSLPLLGNSSTTNANAGTPGVATNAGSRSGGAPHRTSPSRDRMFVKDDVPIATGETHTLCVAVSTRGELRVTLAWTDAPAPVPIRPGKSALVNDLDLEVLRGGGEKVRNFPAKRVSPRAIGRTRPFLRDGRYDQKGAFPRIVTLACLRNTNPGYTRARPTDTFFFTIARFSSRENATRRTTSRNLSRAFAAAPASGSRYPSLGIP